MNMKKNLWEKLAKQLQQALEDEIKEHKETTQNLEDARDLNVGLLSELMKAKGVIEYLEQQEE